jgi:PKD repeat protein
MEAADTEVTYHSFTASDSLSANSSVNGAFAFSGWDTGGMNDSTNFYSHTDTINLAKYYEFKIHPQFGQGLPQYGQGISITNIRLNVKRSFDGPRMFSFRSSETTVPFRGNLAATVFPTNPKLTVQTDTVGIDVANIYYFATDTSMVFNEVKVNLTGAHINTDDTITFRIYAWNAESPTGTFEIDSVTLVGAYGTIENMDNYMDYSYCDNMFTLGQAERMHAALNSSVSSRDSLWTPANHAITGIDNPQICVPQADFYSIKTMACQNSGQVQFFDYSSRGAVTSRTWSFPNGTFVSPTNASSQNPIVTFNTLYSQSATLTVSNASGSSTITKDNLVWVAPNWVDYIGLYSEDFEDLSRFNVMYRVDNRSNNASSWHIDNTAAYPSGTHGLKLNAFSPIVLSTNTTPIYVIDWGIGGYDKDAFITPAFDLDHINNNTGRLEFKLSAATRASTSADVKDTLRVYYSVNCGNTWTLTGTYNGAALCNAGSWQAEFAPSTQMQWSQKSINLPNGALAPNVRFKFEYQSGDFSNDIYIDDINIAGIVGIEDNAPVTADLRVFPNPAGDDVSVSYRLSASRNVKIEVFDAIGNLVYDLVNQKQAAGAYTVTFNTSKISNGIYQIKLSGDNVSLRTEKLVVIR